MQPAELEILRNLASALGAGMLIGLERTYNARSSAGLRTHGLVALASAAVAAIAFLPLFPTSLGDVSPDPSRLAQGVMTGLGFLGAGVIFKEGLSVQGLPTAAALWATAAVGLLFGFGMMSMGWATTIAIVFVLFVLRWLELRVRWPIYALAVLRFQAADAPAEAKLKAVLGDKAASVSDVSYKLTDGGRTYEYWLNLKVRDARALGELAEALKATPGLAEFELSPINK